MKGRAAGEERSGGAAATKPMTSPVNWALLGLLMERPGYGYQLRQRFERAYGNVLPLGSESHIYTALNELKRRGLIEEATETPTATSGTDRQPKVRYQATAEGTDGYREWMVAQVSEDRRQSQLFVRQLAVFAREPDAALEILDCLERECLKEATLPPGPRVSDSRADPPFGLTDRLVSEESRLAMEGRLPWVQYARKEFRALSDRDRGDGAA
jgi:DNA-binding PadR family transcriptional regulator